MRLDVFRAVNLAEAPCPDLPPEPELTSDDPHHELLAFLTPDFAKLLELSREPARNIISHVKGLEFESYQTPRFGRRESDHVSLSPEVQVLGNQDHVTGRNLFSAMRIDRHVH
jgi:hypothetical protein